MGTYLLQRRLGGAAPGRAGWALMVAVAVWSAFAINAAFGFVHVGIPSSALLVLGVPLALVGAGLLRRTPADPALRLSAGWSATLLGALVSAIAISVEPIVVFVIPAIAMSAVIWRRRPAAAVVLVVFLTGTFGSVEAFTPVPVGESVDLVLGGLWCGVLWSWLFSDRREPVWLWPGVALSIAYLGVLAVFVVFADDLFRGLFGFRASAWYMAVFLLIAYARWDAPTYRRIATGFVAVAALVGGYATFRWIVGPAEAEMALALSTDGQYQFVDGELRLFGSFPGGKALSAWAAVAIPFCTAFALTFRSHWRFVAAASVVALGIGLLGTQARAGFVATIAGLVLVLVLYQFSRGVPGLHLGVTAAAVLAIAGVGIVLFSTTAGSDEGSARRYSVLLTPTQDPAFQARLFKWGTALDEIDTHPLGHGIGEAGMAEQRFRRFITIASSNLDNSYLKVAYEHGLAVLGLFAATLLTLLGGLARRALFTRDRHRAGLAIGGAGALVALMVLMFSGMYIEGLTALTAWILVGLGVAQFTTRPSEEPAPA